MAETARAEARGGWFTSAIFATLLAIIRFTALLILELVVAILIYSYLALYHTELFGFLARQASVVFDQLAQIIVASFPATADQAYATAFGELAPKSMLLLMIGLAVGAIMRFVAWAIGRLIRAGQRPHERRA
ncbi:MAG: hypothetical protein AAFO62_13175 [Pseudomonadota bacterium]